MPVIHIYSPPKEPNFKDLGHHGHDILSDWFDQQLDRSVRFYFAVFDQRFHFLVESKLGSGFSHPESLAGTYQAELWKYDVAEFFLLDPLTGHYLEFNLSPNGAWWTCGFSDVLVPMGGQPAPVPHVETTSQELNDSWRAQASFPLDWLSQYYHFGSSSRLNTTFILNSPSQIFLTANPPKGNQPNFHQRELMNEVKFISLA